MGLSQTDHDIWENWTVTAGASHAGDSDSFSLGL
jgi:hypothetical protein